MTPYAQNYARVLNLAGLEKLAYTKMDGIIDTVSAGIGAHGGYQQEGNAGGAIGGGAGMVGGWYGGKYLSDALSENFLEQGRTGTKAHLLALLLGAAGSMVGSDYSARAGSYIQDKLTGG